MLVSPTSRLLNRQRRLQQAIYQAELLVRSRAGVRMHGKLLHGGWPAARGLAKTHDMENCKTTVTLTLK
jgi:hypothetical protein